MKLFDKHLKIKFCVFPTSQLIKDVIWEKKHFWEKLCSYNC